MAFVNVTKTFKWSLI